ncbi:MAG TPA: GntR family transcriptional regulator [Burkholderiaceae bacterium]|jgi:DNA-binding GntR family transcriptional regulator
MSRSASPSASSRVYISLRERILDMTLVPGTRLVEFDIAAEHRVSRTPVHEAVQRLAEEGLVEILQRVGTFVARIPVDELEDAMLVRTALEVALIQKAAERITPAAIEQLRGILAEQRRCDEALDLPGFHRSDEAFHAALATIAACPGVWRTILQSKAQVDRFRRLTLPIEGRMESVIDEHEEVVNALASGQGAQAAAAMRAHLEHVLPVIKVTRGFRPDYFVNTA